MRTGTVLLVPAAVAALSIAVTAQAPPPSASARAIKSFYDVTFPLFEKVVTRLDANQSPVYGFLWKSGYLPAWNFAKYVIGRNGQVVAFFPSLVTPESPELRAAIDKALAQ